MELAYRHLTSVNINNQNCLSKELHDQRCSIVCDINLINTTGNCNDYCPAKKCQVTSFLPFVHINSARESDDTLYNKCSGVVMHRSYRSLNNPPGNPLAFDQLSCPRGWEFDTRMCPGGRTFDCKGGGGSGI